MDSQYFGSDKLFCVRILAFLLFLILLPVSLLVSVALFCSAPGSVLFYQERIGLNKRVFIIYKFKTMKNQRITFAGKVVRKLGLDEIPQLLNIVKGEMAFVGPRPLTSFDIERLGWNSESCNDRWEVLPGITGLAQLTNVCNASLSLQKDLEYATTRTWKMDLRIVVRSSLVPFLGKHTS